METLLRTITEVVPILPLVVCAVSLLLGAWLFAAASRRSRTALAWVAILGALSLPFGPYQEPLLWLIHAVPVVAIAVFAWRQANAWWNELARFAVGGPLVLVTHSLYFLLQQGSPSWFEYLYSLLVIETFVVFSVTVLLLIARALGDRCRSRESAQCSPASSLPSAVERER